MTTGLRRTLGAGLVGLILPALIATGANASAATSAATGGVTLDGYGGLHAFGGYAIDTGGAPYWGGWDIARAVVPRPDGTGGWMLDGWGGVHGFGHVPAIATPCYWPGWDIARALVLTSQDSSGQPDGRQGYLLDGWGGLHPFGGAPPLTGFPYVAGRDLARGLLIHSDSQGAPDGGWELFEDGTVHAFGAATPMPAIGHGGAVWQQLHVIAGASYGVGRYGIVRTGSAGGTPTSIAANWSGYSDWGAWDISRDVVIVGAGTGFQPASPSALTAFAAADHGDRGGTVLDGWGGLHPFGGTGLNTAQAPYWPGWDIARALVTEPDGSGGWVLDGWGGIHAFGAAVGVDSPAYWSGWDIARALVMVSRTPDGRFDGQSGYVLDGYGGLHGWGGAPALPAPYRGGQDRARGLRLHYGSGGVPDGGWTSWADGSITQFGAAAAVASAPALTPAPVWQAIHDGGSGGYSVGRFGVTSTVAGIDWSGYPDWGGWDIVRDVVINSTRGDAAGAAPVSPGAAGAFRHAENSFLIPGPILLQEHGLSCEAAALRVALAALGTSVSEGDIINFIGSDRTPAQRDYFGSISRWGNPYKTFVGNIDAAQYNATGYGVYYPPIAAYSATVGHQAQAGEGWDPGALYRQVLAGHPAVVWVTVRLVPSQIRWWTAWDGTSIHYTPPEHAMTLVGVDLDAGTVTLVDVEFAQLVTVGMGTFQASFASLNNMAAVIQ